MSRPELTARYLLVVDSLNFCFWQDEEFEYENLAGGIKVKSEGSLAVVVPIAYPQARKTWPNRSPNLPHCATLSHLV